MGLFDKLLRRKQAPPLVAAVEARPPSVFRANPVLATIEVSEVTPARTALPTVPYKSAIETLLAPPALRRGRRPGNTSVGGQAPLIEAWSCIDGELVADVTMHPLMAAIHLAFADHRPLVLSPDMIWLLVAQGFANHVNANSEELRPRLVRHSGKVTLRVVRNDFVKSSPANPWPEVFDEFAGQIRGHVGDETSDLLLPVFSTTGSTETAATQLVLLDSLKSFFDYELKTLCGVPQIMLEGSVDDWTLLMERTQSLSRLNLGWWIEPLTPILQEFVSAARGQANSTFWRSIYKSDDMSGGPYTTGWITAFFPYLTKSRTGQAIVTNEWLTKGGHALTEVLYPKLEVDGRHGGKGPTTNEFPSGLASAPLLWRHGTTEFKMDMLGGFVGVQQDSTTLRLRPEIGWVIREILD